MKGLSRVPSVTTVLRDVGLSPSFNGFEDAAELKARLGSDVHKLCSNGKTPEGPAGDYARSFQRWLATAEAEIVDSEFEVKGGRCGLDYIGHCDLLMRWRGAEWVVDIKTTSGLHPSYGVQLAAYSLCIPTPDRYGLRRGVLWLTPNKAKLASDPPIVRDIDYDSWNSALQLWYAGFRPGAKRS